MRKRRYDMHLRLNEAEQKKLLAETEIIEAELSKEAKHSTDLRLLLKTIREQTDMKPLAPELVNTLIRRIGIRAPIKVNGKRTVAVDTHFTGAGLFTVSKERACSQFRMLMKSRHQSPKFPCNRHKKSVQS